MSSPPINDDPRSRLAAEMFPAEWAKVASLPGASKRRNYLRHRAEVEKTLRALRAAGASCATCRSFERRPHGKEMICAANSDFHGYQITGPDGLCARFERNTISGSKP